MQEQSKKPNSNDVPQIGSDKEPLLPGQKAGLDPQGADKFNVHPRSVVWHDAKAQAAWDALHANDEEGQ